jgi:hydroxypyruvate isomerase
VAPDGALADALEHGGYTPLAFPSNYPAADRVEAALWNVPETVAAQARLFAAPAGQGPNLRVLIMSPGTEPTADPRVARDFYRTVLGTEVPQLPAAANIAGVRVRAWTFIIEDVSKARDRLRDAGMEVTLEPVRFASPYLGDHWTMGVRAPDGAIVELVQGSAR